MRPDDFRRPRKPQQPLRDVAKVRIYTVGVAPTWKAICLDVDGHEIRELTGLMADQWYEIAARLLPTAEIVQLNLRGAARWVEVEWRNLEIVEKRAVMLVGRERRGNQ